MNENYKSAMASLLNEDVLLHLQGLAEIPEHEEQGYQSAKYIMEATGIKDPNELLMRMMLNPRRSRPSDNDAKRDIGVIRWCLDNRAK